jgi:hypothetical protein
MHSDLRFFGHYIHEAAGFERATQMVRQEMKERLPDAEHPGGYAPDEKFKKEASRFGAEYRELRDDLLTRIKSGGQIKRDEYVTLVRAERLNIEANSGSGLLKHRLSLLESGKNAFGFPGMSDSLLIGKLSGHDRDDGPRDQFTVKIDHGLRR